MTAARILIVEDEAILAEELRERVGRMGLVVAGVSASGRDAIERADSTQPDLVLMDIRLQGAIDGVEAATAIREQFDLPVVFVTAHSDAATVARVKRAGPFGYVIKPFTQDELAVAIELGLDRHAADRTTRTLLETQKTDSLGRVAGAVAHDFSNLLMPIMGNASLAALEVDPDSRVARYLDRINEAAERAAVLCRQMLAYSGKGQLQIDRSSVNAIIDGTRELLRSAVRKGTALSFDLASDLPDADLDPNQMQQLLLNLVLNAGEAIGDTQGTVLIRTRAETRPAGRLAFSPDGPGPGTYVVIEVADTGAGIDPQVRERIFDPFFTTKAFGRGLGLAAARGIARGHRGSISVESAPGHGATFRIHLPAHPRSSAPPPISVP